MYCFHCPQYLVQRIPDVLANLEGSISTVKDDCIRLEFRGRLFYFRIYSEVYFANLSMSTTKSEDVRPAPLEESTDPDFRPIARVLSATGIQPVMPKIDDELTYIEHTFKDEEIRTLVRNARAHHEQVTNLVVHQRFEEASFYKDMREEIRERLGVMCIEFERRSDPGLFPSHE